MTVVQAVIDRMAARTYLEIGVAFGLMFLSVRAPRRIAVDPRFMIPYPVRRFTRGGAHGTEYYELTSDEFFAQAEKLLRDEPIDVIFIDGLHTYEQSLRDVNNGLRFLSEEGVIVLHDCSPSTAPMATPASSFAAARKTAKLGWTMEWSGDVWKTIVHLRSTRPDLQVHVFDCDHGVGIVRRGPAEEAPRHTPEEIGRMSYEDLDRNRPALLGLKDYAYLNPFLETLSPIHPCDRPEPERAGFPSAGVR